MDSCRATKDLTPLFRWVQVDLSIINGAIVVRDGKLMTADLQHIIADHNKRSEAICKYYTEAAVGSGA